MSETHRDELVSELQHLLQFQQWDKPAWVARLDEVLGELRTEAQPDSNDDERKESRSNLAGEPFVGMWRDRAGLEDSAAWVRQVRDRHWKSS